LTQTNMSIFVTSERTDSVVIPTQTDGTNIQRGPKSEASVHRAAWNADAV